MRFHETLETPLYSQLVDRIRQLSSPIEPQQTGLQERFTRLPGIRVVLFDIYGTLFLSGTGDISIASEMSNEASLAEALRYAGFSGNLEQAGQRGTDYLLDAIRQTHATRCEEGAEAPEVDIRQEWERVVMRLQEEGLLEGELTEEAILRVSVDYECRVNPIWPMPDVAATLQALDEKKVLLGIVSNAQFYTKLLFPAFLERSYEALGFLPELCVWSYKLLEAKPSGAMFRGIVELLQQQDIAPHEILYVGNDMLNDIWTASQAGLRTALFAGDQRSLRLREQDARCASLEPDVIVTDLYQLVQVIA